jgi:hypothetical protein
MQKSTIDTGISRHTSESPIVCAKNIRLTIKSKRIAAGNNPRNLHRTSE